jgi:hypothetical protein
MTRHWAIVIGINQYQFRQPLQCAQSDAQDLYDWFTQEGGLNARQTILSTDSSPVVQGRATYPTAEVLKTWIDWLRKEGIQAGDRLWIFFSGYGECWEGQDYLLPIDAAEQCSPRTWLSVRSLLSSLKTLPTDQILLLLDMNRSQSSRTDDRVGRQTMTLAKELGIPTILSCQPEQFSHESSAVGNGFFTAALLEGLRIHAGQPLGVLVKFLQRRVPELSEHSYRPRQDPLIMVAPKQLEECLLPGLSGVSGQTMPTRPQRMMPQTVPPQAVLNEMESPTSQNAVTMPPTQPPMLLGERSEPIGLTHAAGSNATEKQRRLPSLPIEAAVREPISREPINREPAAITLEDVVMSEPDKTAKPLRPASPLAPETELTTRQFLWRVLILGGLIGLVLGLAALLRSWAPPVQNAQNQVTAPSPKPSAPAASPTPMPTAPSPDPSVRLDVPESPPADSAKILEDARAMIRPTSASELQDAIDRASQIPPGDGRYPETKRQIDRWCQDMLDLASQRAQRGKFGDAVKAAELIPEKVCSAIVPEAEKAKARWRKRLR